MNNVSTLNASIVENCLYLYVLSGMFYFLMKYLKNLMTKITPA